LLIVFRRIFQEDFTGRELKHRQQ